MNCNLHLSVVFTKSRKTYLILKFSLLGLCCWKGQCQRLYMYINSGSTWKLSFICLACIFLGNYQSGSAYDELHDQCGLSDKCSRQPWQIQLSLWDPNWKQLISHDYSWHAFLIKDHRTRLLFLSQICCSPHPMSLVVLSFIPCLFVCPADWISTDAYTIACLLFDHLRWFELTDRFFIQLYGEFNWNYCQRGLLLPVA